MNRRNLLKSIFYIPLAALGMNKTLAALAAPAKDTTTRYGGSSDIWGYPLLPSDINNPNFGVRVNTTDDRTFYV